MLNHSVISGAGHSSRYVASHPGQLSLAILSWVGAIVPAKGWRRLVAGE